MTDTTTGSPGDTGTPPDEPTLNEPVVDDTTTNPPGLPSAFADAEPREGESVVERSQRVTRLTDTNGPIDVNLGGEGVRAAAPHLFGDRPADPVPALAAVDTTGLPGALGALTTEGAPQEEVGAATTGGVDGSYIDTTEHGTSMGDEVKAAVAAVGAPEEPVAETPQEPAPVTEPTPGDPGAPAGSTAPDGSVPDTGEHVTKPPDATSGSGAPSGQ